MDVADVVDEVDVAVADEVGTVDTDMVDTVDPPPLLLLKLVVLLRPLLRRKCHLKAILTESS